MQSLSHTDCATTEGRTWMKSNGKAKYVDGPALFFGTCWYLTIMATRRWR
jgi:hypothetical protein